MTVIPHSFQQKNSLINHNGFFPSQLVFGQNPNLPNFINNTLPAQEPVVKSPDIITYLTALHTARKSCIESESYNKLKQRFEKMSVHRVMSCMKLVMKFSLNGTIHQNEQVLEQS